MEQSPSCEAISSLASQEIPRGTQREFRYLIHKCPPPVLVLSHLDPVHIPT